MSSFCIVIPAIKKKVAFVDDLVKKLAGISLIQRAINKSLQLNSADHIHVVTDSLEISLICERNGVNPICNANFDFDLFETPKSFRSFSEGLARKYDYIVLLSPYAPLTSQSEIKKSYQKFLKKKCDILIPVKREKHRIFSPCNQKSSPFFLQDEHREYCIESKCFRIFRSNLFLSEIKPENEIKVCSQTLIGEAVEIDSYQRWWICEKLIKRRKILFRVIGDRANGMGHVFRALSLAHEITDHEVLFVCNENSKVVVNKFASLDYRLVVFKNEEIEDQIIALQPDLVINDILNTELAYIQKLQKAGIKVVNFEDLGSGASQADWTFNALYDKPEILGDQIVWGKQCFVLRDEFTDATPHIFKEKVNTLLLTFGGIDQRDLTRKSLRTIFNFCRTENIKIFIVVGDAYIFIDALQEDITNYKGGDIEFTHASRVMSSIMEKTQIAISGNGRTVYELAHMNIPSVVLSHHDRERTHRFACPENGFIDLGVYTENQSEYRILEELKRLVFDVEHRKNLFKKMEKHNFIKNKGIVIKNVLDLLEP